MGGPNPGGRTARISSSAPRPPDGPFPGDCKRTFQHHYLCRRPLALAALALTDEVTGFVEVDLFDFGELMEGRARAIPAAVLTKGSEGVRTGSVTSRELSLYSAEVRETFRLVMRAAGHVLETGQVDAAIFEKK